MRVVPFKPEHALSMLVQPSQQLEWHDRQALARKYAEAGNAFTIFAPNGRPIFCGGAVELHEEHAQLWAMFACDKRGAMTRVLRATKSFIAGLRHRRVDTPVLDRPEAVRWAELLGMRFDVRIADAAPGGGDVLLYRRID